MYVVDASIILAALFVTEPNHTAAKRFLDQIKDRHERIIVPEILHLEVASAIARVTADEAAAERFANALLALPGFTFVPLNREFVLQARSIAVHNRLRSLDSCYLAVARQYGLTLVTLDKEQRSRAPADVTVKSV